MTAARQTLSSLGEFGWLRRLIPRLYWPKTLQSRLCIGPGDDAGVLGITPGKVLVATTDAMVEGHHFERAWFPWQDLGEKVLAVNLSDLAAMGDVKPLAALVTAAFPGDTPVGVVDKFYQGLENGARRWKTGLLGGDTVGSRRDWFISVTVLGEARPEGLVRRSGARVGDLVATTGPLGLAGAGLEVLQSGKRRLGWTAPLVRAFSRPQPRFDAGRVLGRRRWATSLLDSSDGLEASVRLLAETSGVGVEVDLDRLPLPPALVRWANRQGRPAWSYALTGGEDYELIFTVSPSVWATVRRRLRGVTAIGRIVPRKEGMTAVSGSRRFPLKTYGYSHFKNARA